MGQAKARMIEEEDRGWSTLDDTCVCPDCITDEFLASVVRSNVSSSRCDYCNMKRSEPFAAPADLVLGLVCRGIQSEWAPAEAELPYESRDGGFFGETIDKYDLLRNLEITENETLFDQMVSSIHDLLWCQRDYFRLTEHEQFVASWETFQNTVKHETRYLFTMNDEISEEDIDLREYPPASHTLQIIGDAMTSAGLAIRIERGTSYFRARVHKSDEYHTAAQLGTPLIKDARFSNRMSPAGIPMFYGALDADTAFKEVHEPQKPGPCKVSIGRFRAERDLLILDLSQPLIMPSLFDDQRREMRPSISFLSEFVRDVAKPIEKNDREHIEYVPTQIVTEYVRRFHKTVDGLRVDGIHYCSSKSAGGVCCVLFADSSNCVDDGGKSESDTWLSMAREVEVRDCAE